MTQIIDSHLHIWDLATGLYGWPDETVPELNRNFGIEDAALEMEREGVDAVVLVQAADNAAETRLLLATASSADFVAGVIGWVPLDEPERLKELICEFRDSSKFVGVRSLIHTLPDPSWIASSSVTAGLCLVADAGLTFDYVTADPSTLEYVPLLAQRHPGLRIVIDHLGKPPIGGDSDEFRSWAGLLRGASAEPTVFAKLSGLYPASLAMDAGTPGVLLPFVLEALDAFGPSRLMWGSDWPVSLISGGYQQSRNAVESAVLQMAPDWRDEIFGGNARRIYRLGPPEH
jgi:L-fuconolactonase